VVNLDKTIKDCIAGKAKAQETVYNMFAAKLYGLCLRYTRDQQEAEDILQEGFIKIFEHIGQLNKYSSLEAWMKKIMINIAIEKFRNKRLTTSYEDIHEIPELIEKTKALDHIGEEELLKMIKELSPQYRIVFNLYVIEGYSHKEISQQLNISEGTSKSNLSRARSILQEKIKTLLDTEQKNIARRK